MAKSLRRRTRPHRCNYRQPRTTNVRARTAKWVALADWDKLGAVLSAAPDSDARPHPPGNPQPTLDTHTVFADPVAWSLSVTTGHRACGVFRLSTVGEMATLHATTATKTVGPAGASMRQTSSCWPSQSVQQLAPSSWGAIWERCAMPRTERHARHCQMGGDGSADCGGNGRAPRRCGARL